MSSDCKTPSLSHGSTVLIFAALACALMFPAAPTADDVPARPDDDAVVLVHGFFRTGRDMRYLAGYLAALGYHVVVPDLPTTFGSLDECTARLEEVIADSLDIHARLHLVGHSLGGLVIRNYLSRNLIPGPGRCVLIGTPNRGTDLAVYVRRYLPPLTWLFKPYEALVPDAPPIPPPLNDPHPVMGGIAGNDDSLLLGSLIDGESDGRVPVDSVPFPGMSGFVVLPYHHEEIHHRERTARLVARFLATGSFGEGGATVRNDAHPREKGKGDE